MPDGAASGPADGSMETILASIRRIIREDEAATGVIGAPEAAAAEDEELLVLDPSMMVEPPKAAVPVPVGLPPLRAESVAVTQTEANPAEMAPIVDMPPVLDETPPPVRRIFPPALPAQAATPAAPAPAAEVPLLSPLATAAAAESFATLQDALRTDAAPPAELRLLRHGGPTIEDMVREELRLQLKGWLDDHLPPLVERMVRQEVERLSRRHE